MPSPAPTGVPAKPQAKPAPNLKAAKPTQQQLEGEAAAVAGDPGAVITTSSDSGNSFTVAAGVPHAKPSQPSPNPSTPPLSRPLPQPVAPAAPPLPAPPPEPPVPVIDNTALLTEYASEIKAQVLAQKEYPSMAERLGHEGTVKVSFTLGSGGELSAASIRISSGFPELDQAALEAITQASPFAPFPTGVSQSSLSLALTLHFRLQ